MEHERLRWITSPPTLDSFQITGRFVPSPSGLLLDLYADGRCDRKRSTLWTHSELVEVGGDRYQASDLIHHLALVILQDRPNSNVALTRGLCGAAWEQPELPF